MHFLTVLAWLAAALGGFLASALLVMESRGWETPPGFPLKARMWGRCVWAFLAGIVWLMFSDM